MNNVKTFKQIGAYGLLIVDEEILLIKKCGGPYDGKLDLPGGTIEFDERPEDALHRELIEEVGIELEEYELHDVDSVSFDWKYNDVLVKVHHIGIFYKITRYRNDIKSDIEVDLINDDSLGAEFYKISELRKNQLSNIAI